jgi:hypothetical protein
MSYYNEENDNLCQKTQGFNDGYDSYDNQYELTPNESEKVPNESELDEDIYDEQQEDHQTEQFATDVNESTVAAPAPAPVTSSKSNFWNFKWLMTKQNIMILSASLVVLIAFIFFLHWQKLITLPSMSAPTFFGGNVSGLSSNSGVSKCNYGVTSSSFSSSTLGQNLGNMTNTIF